MPLPNEFLGDALFNSGSGIELTVFGPGETASPTTYPLYPLVFESSCYRDLNFYITDDTDPTVTASW